MVNEMPNFMSTGQMSFFALWGYLLRHTTILLTTSNNYISEFPLCLHKVLVLSLLPALPLYPMGPHIVTGLKTCTSNSQTPTLHHLKYGKLEVCKLGAWENDMLQRHKPLLLHISHSEFPTLGTTIPGLRSICLGLFLPGWCGNLSGELLLLNVLQVRDDWYICREGT